MIVTCHACQTRFRVADDKVGPRGVKVRCSRCQTIFLVQPAAAPAADPFAAFSLPAPADPFAASGAPASADPFAATAAPARARASPTSRSVPRPATRAFPSDSLGRPAPIPVIAAPAPSDPFAVSPDPFGLESPEPARPPASAVRPESSAPFDPGSWAGELGGAPQPGSASGLELDLPPQRRADPAPRPPDPAPAVSRPAATLAPAGAAEPPAAASADPRSGGVPARPAAPAAPERAPEPPGPSSVRAAAVNVLSLAALLAVAVGFFMFWRGEGRVDLHLLFQRDGATPVSAPNRPLILAARVTNGVYETAHGKNLFFVRGELQSQGAAAGPIRVKVALLDGERVAAEVEGLAGALPTPEELHAIGSAADAEKLLRRIADRAPPRARPGEWLPFLLPLADAPADRGLALRVRAEAGR